MKNMIDMLDDQPGKENEVGGDDENEADEKEIQLKPQQEDQVKQAIETLKSVADDQGCEVQELFEHGLDLASGNEDDAGSDEDDSGDQGKGKVALLVAQMKAKRGE